MPTQVVSLLKVLGFLVLFALGAGIFLFDRASGTESTAEAATYTRDSQCEAYEDRRYYEYDTNNERYNDRTYRDDQYDRSSYRYSDYRYDDRYHDRYDYRRVGYYEQIDYEYGYDNYDPYYDERFRERYYGSYNDGRSGEFTSLWLDYREAWDRVDEALYYDYPYGDADILLSHAENELWEAETEFRLGRRSQAFEHADRARDLIEEAFRELR